MTVCIGGFHLPPLLDARNDHAPHPSSKNVNLSSLKAFIFDLDGTLVDSLTDLATAVNRMLDANGYPRVSIDIFPQHIGDGMKKLVERALPADKRDSENAERCADEYLAHYEKCWHDATHVYEGMADVVAKLRARGVRLGVISNKPHRFTVLCAEHFFPAGSFEVILGQREGIPRKPDAAGGREIVQRLGLEAAECAYIGDSGVDMEFGKATGMRRIGALWGFRDRAELVAAGAEVLITHPSELLAETLPELVVQSTDA